MAFEVEVFPERDLSMNVAIASLLVAGLMPIVCAGIAKAGKKNYDNHNPREWLAQQTGYRARANAAGVTNFAIAAEVALGFNNNITAKLCFFVHSNTGEINAKNTEFIAIKGRWAPMFFNILAG